MASKNKDYKPEDIAFPEQHIVQSELVGEMTTSYIEYAMSVIIGRALPDVRDGLKPVHRRILYAMYEDNLTHDKPFRKCATAVGDVLGRYHPHGDASVYDALVRLAQDFSMRYPLIDGHGNFGSVDGDPPAAYRYTEARMARMSDEMLRDIEKDTVDWDPNFDETRKEPRVLPSRFPNLLVNGSSGIAVGMATNIPPHNLTEVINACICVLDNPEATMNELLQHVTGPDFPTKGIILGRSGIRQAYMTGRGKVIMRARTEFEEFGKDRTRIIVTELPYQVNKRQLIATIAENVRDKRIEGISDLRDETDRNGMRIVIELKKDANPQVVLNNLFKQTALQSSFGIIMLALVDGEVTVTDINADGVLTYDEALQAAHTAYCPGGYESAETEWGVSVSKLWNVSTMNCLFFLNDSALANHVGDTATSALHAGDYLVASVNKDNTYYADHYVSFARRSATATAGKEFALNLSGSKGSDKIVIGTWNTGKFTAIDGYSAEYEAGQLDDEVRSILLPLLNLEDDMYTDLAASVSSMMVRSYAVAIVKPAEGKTDAGKSALEAYVTSEQQSMEHYLEDQYQIAKNAKVETLPSGEVVLVCCEDSDTVLANLKKALAA